MEAARQLLNAAVQRGGAHEVALAFLTRIDRMSALQTPLSNPSATGAAGVATRLAAKSEARRRSPVALVLLGVAILGVATYGITYSERFRAWLPSLIPQSSSGTEVTPAKALHEPLVVPRASETALERAQTLFASGRLYDAIRAVDLVRPTDPLRPQAERLKETIQRELLAHAAP